MSDYDPADLGVAPPGFRSRCDAVGCQWRYLTRKSLIVNQIDAGDDERCTREDLRRDRFGEQQRA